MDHTPPRSGAIRYHDGVTSAFALHVVLVHPEIPWNTGNIGRTCLATGAALHLVRPLGFSLASREVRRAGLDYWERLAPRVWPDWPTFETAATGLGEAFLFSAEGSRTLWDIEFPPRTVLVFGRESVGLPLELRRRFRHRLLRIPMASHEVRSLNLSTSVAVALFEVLRQHRLGEGSHDPSKRTAPGTRLPVETDPRHP